MGRGGEMERWRKRKRLNGIEVDFKTVLLCVGLSEAKTPVTLWLKKI